MPSPVGHALAGVAVGWLVDGRQGAVTRANVLTAAAYGLAATAPDLDLLLETHRGPTHGIGFAVIAGLAVWAMSRRARTALAFALAYGSHILLDWLGTDTTPPIGLTALWPFSNDYYQSPLHVFMAVSRRYWLPEFWTYNVRVLLRELLILGPAMLAAGLLRGPLRRRAAVVGAVLLHGALAAGAMAQTAPSYADVLAKYRAGEFEPAVRMLASMPTRDVENKRRLFAVTDSGMRRDGDIRAAIMLHTELHFAQSDGPVAHAWSWHLEHARDLARAYFDLRHDRRDRADFVRTWYLLLAARFQGLHHVSRSAEYLEEARALFPGDGEILLASGSHYEVLARLGRISYYDREGTRTRVSGVDVAQALGEAARYFREALAVDPRLDEAALRLGRILHQSGDLQGARRELDAVRGRTTQLQWKYLAATFLGAVEEDLGDRRAAAKRYVEAIQAFPAGQASYVGFSELLYTDAQPEEAAKVVTMLLERPAPRDPWWGYLMGEWWHFDARLTAMRQLVRQ